MKKGWICLVIAFFTLTSFMTEDYCGDYNVMNPNGDADHPFWGTSVIGSYNYVDQNNCIVHVTCYRKYIFWINVNTYGTPSEPLCVD